MKTKHDTVVLKKTRISRSKTLEPTFREKVDSAMRCQDTYVDDPHLSSIKNTLWRNQLSLCTLSTYVERLWELIELSPTCKEAQMFLDKGRIRSLSDWKKYLEKQIIKDELKVL